MKFCISIIVMMTLGTNPVWAEDETHILLQSTTSTQNSGLFDHLLPLFQATSGIEVRVVAVGTGQALRNAAEGNGDAVMVHARTAEERFVADGFGVARIPVMYNEFVIVGPPADPADVGAASSLDDAMQRIASTKSPFISRGDDSGTHKRERALWAGTGIGVSADTHDWYKDSGSGMGRTLQIAAELGAYTLSDRATWLAQNNREALPVLFAGDAALFNQYSIILVNPERHPHVKAAAATRFIQWLTGDEGQAAIAGFRLGGEQLFFPNAGTP